MPRLTSPLAFRIQCSINRKTKTNVELEEGKNSRKQRGTPLSPGSKVFWKATQEGLQASKPNHHRGYQTQLRRPLGPFTATETTIAGPKYLRRCPCTCPACPTAQTGHLKFLDVLEHPGGKPGVSYTATNARTRYGHARSHKLGRVSTIICSTLQVC